MNSKIIMLIPARTMTDILIQNTGFTKYSVAWLMNKSEPVIAASTKAAQVNGRSCRESSANGRLAAASPSRRKSTIVIVPSTSETAKKWATWTVVKAHGFMWMNTAHDHDCSVSKNAVMDCKFTSPDVLCLFLCWCGAYVTARSAVLQILRGCHRVH